MMASGPSVMALSHLPRTSFSSHCAHYSGLDAPPWLLLRARPAAVNMNDHLGCFANERLGAFVHLCSMVSGVPGVPGIPG